MTQQNQFAGLFEEDEMGRRTLFGGRFAGRSPFEQNFLSSRFEPTFNRYLGQLGQQIGKGEAPNLTFSDFLSRDFNPQRELLRQPGRDSGLFGGRTIFDFGR